MLRAFSILLRGVFFALSMTFGMTPAFGGSPGSEQVAMLTPSDVLRESRAPAAYSDPIAAIEKALDDGSLQAALKAKSFWSQPRVLTVYRHGLRREESITYWKDGKYIRSGLRQLNKLCVDLHNGKVARMDKEVFDSLWVAQRMAARFGFDSRMEITSGYRSPQTNKDLRANGVKAAKKSLHTLGKAVDFRIAGLPNKVLGSMMRAFGLGGVGTYHREEGGWVHVDTGHARHWKG